MPIAQARVSQLCSLIRTRFAWIAEESDATAQADGDQGPRGCPDDADYALAEIEEAALELQEMCAELRKNWR